MRFRVVVCGIVCAGILCAGGLPRTAAAGEKFPYTAYTNSDDVYIRSGPGKNYYPTDKLAKGEPVEIYRQDPGGWYAIRPPQGSFSWVPADALKPIGDRMAVVQKDQTPCFVGTRFSNARDVHQVRLDQGEQVEILDIKPIGDGSDTQSWCQIAPPSGEFRWVFGKYIDRELPPGVSHSEKSRGAAENGDRTARNPGWLAKGSVKSVATDGADSAGADGSPRRESNWHSTGKTAAEERPAPMGDPFQAELNSIDLEVSKIAADDQATWEFTALRRRAEALLPHSETALERGRVRLVLNRIARFEDVKRRYDLLNQPGSAIASNRPSVLPVDDPNRYDGIGKLAPVVSQRPNAPRYALIDNSNQVVSFVTPAPGVDLQAYVGKSVGVSGQRGFMPELGKPHVTAQRIALVDSPTLR
jgi:SH3-like domain-containing protein